MAGGTAGAATLSSVSAPVGNEGITPFYVKTLEQYLSSSENYTLVLKGRGNATGSSVRTSGNSSSYGTGTYRTGTTGANTAGTNALAGNTQSGSRTGTSTYGSNTSGTSGSRYTGTAAQNTAASAGNSASGNTSLNVGNISQTGQTVTKVNIKAPGVLRILGSATATRTIWITLYSDPGCLTAVGNGGYLSGVNATDELNIQVDQAGTYYLKTCYTGETSFFPANDVTVTYRTQLIQNSVDGISKNAQIARNLNIAAPESYHRFTLKKKSRVALGGATLNFDSASGSSSLLGSVLNSKRKTVEDTFFLSDSNNFMKILVLKKGTYYFKTKTNDFVLLMKATKKLGKNLTSVKKKAKTLNKGKKASGYFLNSSKKGKKVFVKINLKKDAKLKFNVAYEGSASLKWKVYPKKGQRLIINSGSVSPKGSRISSTRKFKKGKYLLSIEKTKKAGGAYFEIKNTSK